MAKETVVSASHVPNETHHVKNEVQSVKQPSGMEGGKIASVSVSSLQKPMGTGQSSNDSNVGRKKGMK
jgi:hypothetical protein